MRKTLVVAAREFVSTVMTKGFLIGVLVFPLIMLVVMIVVVPLIVRTEPPKTRGSVAIIDLSPGQRAAPQASQRLSADALRAEQEEAARQIKEKVDALANSIAPDESHAATRQAIVSSAVQAAAQAEIPELTIDILDPATDPELVKDEIRASSPGDAGRLALLVFDPNAVERASDGSFGSFQAFVRPRLDERVQAFITRAARDAVRHARLESGGFDPSLINDLTRVDAPETVTVTPEGERTSLAGAQFFVPMAFMMLLWISAFTGGQYLLTTTIEEKSNRIMEVLLSATSPIQLMVGKIVGQMGVGLSILAVYSILGAGALTTFSLMDLLDPRNLAYLVLYFFIAYFFVAALMAAVGSAVSDVHEAQSLIGPIMMVLVLPMILMPAIITDPNSTLAVVLSFVPPVSPFMMVLRIAAATEPLPAWQIALSLAVGIASVVAAAWAAAKIFRIGVLMYGKPPNLLTLLKWLRMA